jgi:hypothetical protein
LAPVGVISVIAINRDSDELAAQTLMARELDK